MANNSSLSKRAALRQQQELEEQRKKTKRLVNAGIALSAIVIAVVVAIVLSQTLGRKGGTAIGEQLKPTNATSSYGILMEGKAPQKDLPHLVIWQDYQCPACAGTEARYGDTITQLVAAGKITVEIRTATFLDDMLRNDSSYRAAIAAAAADGVGHFEQYHKVVFANQPAREGAGYTDEQLRNTFAEQAGITGDNLKRFQELYDSKAYNDFVKASAEKFATDNIRQTPTFLVAGKQLTLGTTDPTNFLAAVTKAWEDGGKNNNF